MCILCVIQKWSRRVATMLPWLVIPLIGLWALSQLLPPAFRFEITSPRLACVFVLLVTLFWYEILMPQLSSWRVRRNAQLRERKRFEAIELQKLRKTATRRCRNCLTPYRDQNPGGGKFMCAYCGHISKRPVLDLPVPPGNAGILKEWVGKSGKILNSKVWSDNGWMCGQDWLENGNWVEGKSNYWRKNGGGVFGGDEDCLAEKSYSGVVIFACRVLTSFFLSVRWVLRKIFRVSSSSDDDSSDADKGLLAKRGENEGSFPESRGEKARRKAEEKRQARIERELLEEEERKQREEVARLVEERRRLRDEKTEAEKDHSQKSTPVREKDGKKEAERKRQERKKEKDKGSSKSNSDVEELEKKTSKESERKKEFEKKEYQKSGFDLVRGQTYYNRGNAGTRYFDRMRGTIMSSSKAFSGGSFFGRGTSNVAPMAKESKPISSLDPGHVSVQRKEMGQPDRVATRACMNGDDKTVNRLVHSEPQPVTTPKKSWQQLFTRSTPIPLSSNASVISRPNPKSQAEVQSPQLSAQIPTTQSYDNPIDFGSPFSLSTYPNSSLGFTPSIEPVFHRDHTPDEPELFEDPCYIPDPASLLGPVSELLDNFQLDFGNRAVDCGITRRPRVLKNVSANSGKPSPIESPMSREKHNVVSNRFQTRPKSQDAMVNDSNETAMWQMWNTCPLSQDGLGLVGGPASWHMPPELSRPSKDDLVHPSSAHKTMASLFAKDEPVISGSFSPVSGSGDSDPWLQKALFPPLSPSENSFGVKQHPEEATHSEMIYGSPNRVSNYPFEQSPTSSWSKKEWGNPGSIGEGVGKASITRPHVGGLFPTPDVQSLWSFD